MSAKRAHQGGSATLPLRRHDDQHRRHDDIIDSRGMLGLTRFLMNRPNCDQVAEHLVLTLLTGFDVRAAAISHFAGSGTLHLVGSFGVSAEDLDRYRATSLWDSTPVADAVRAGEPLILPESSLVAERYPWLAGEGRVPAPVAVWPLALPQERVGALVLHLAGPVDEASLRIDVSGIVAVLALYLSLTGGTDPASGNGADPHARGSSATRAAEAPERLSDRQLEILRLIARGMTNPQISHRIGFSESTVRQESMAIYRFLGVNGRRDAVRVAHARGILVD